MSGAGDNAVDSDATKYDTFQVQRRKLTRQPTDAEVAEVCDRIAVMAQPIFEKFGWKWGWTDYEVPDIARISSMLSELFTHMLAPDSYEGSETGSGRLVIQRAHTGGYDVLLELGQWRDWDWKGGVRIDEEWEAKDAHV